MKPGRALRTPPAPKLPRLSLRALRSEESVALDREGDHIPPFHDWQRFLREDFNFRQGQHVTLVGPNGSGKTTLARQIIDMREYTVVAATKVKDSSLYGPLTRAGYRITDDPDLDPDQQPKVIFKPDLSNPTSSGRAGQQEAFRELLVRIFAQGGWCLYGDEIRYLSDYLKLETELETLWLQGRSLGVTMVAATQRPVSIPLVAFDQAIHLFLWRNTDRQSVQRMAEFTGGHYELARALIPRLPHHEALYVHTTTGRMVRTKVNV